MVDVVIASLPSLLLASVSAFFVAVVITTVFVAVVAAEVEVEEDGDDDEGKDRAREVGRERIGGGGC